MPDLIQRINVACIVPMEKAPSRAILRHAYHEVEQQKLWKRRTNSVILSSYGSEYAGNGKYAKAIKLFDRALRLDPKNARALKHRAIAKLSLNLSREALKDFNLILKRNPKDKFALHHRGLINCKLRNHERCIGDLTRALGVRHSNMGSILGMIAIAHVTRGRFAAAMEKIKLAKKHGGRHSKFAAYMRNVRAMPELSLGVHALYRPSRGGAAGARTNFGATWYLYNFNKRLTLGAVLSLGYAGGADHHAIDLAGGATLIAEFRNTKLNATVEAGYNFGIHGDALTAANKAGGLFRYGVGVDFRLWNQLWMGVSLSAQHDTDDFRDASLGVGTRLILNIW